ncbi:hypothetical protein SNEBB_009273 [Seison nebaliae]|nr:hypothetical protein SNEBB_009273 [Seison nebaliae]
MTTTTDEQANTLLSSMLKFNTKLLDNSNNCSSTLTTTTTTVPISTTVISSTSSTSYETKEAESFTVQSSSPKSIIHSSLQVTKENGMTKSFSRRFNSSFNAKRGRRKQNMYPPRNQVLTTVDDKNVGLTSATNPINERSVVSHLSTEKNAAALSDKDMDNKNIFHYLGSDTTIMMKNILSSLSQDQVPQQRYKIVIMGASQVGKTSLFHQFFFQNFVEHYLETQQDDIYKFDFHFGTCASRNKRSANDSPFIPSTFVCNESLYIELVDMSGTNEFPAMRRISINEADAFLLVYSLEDSSTLDVINNYLKEIKEGRDNLDAATLPILLVGNKFDLVENIYQISPENKDIENPYVRHLSKDLGTKPFNRTKNLLLKRQSSLHSDIMQINENKESAVTKEFKWSSQIKKQDNTDMPQIFMNDRDIYTACSIKTNSNNDNHQKLTSSKMALEILINSGFANVEHVLCDCHSYSSVVNVFTGLLFLAPWYIPAKEISVFAQLALSKDNFIPDLHNLLPIFFRRTIQLTKQFKPSKLHFDCDTHTQRRDKDTKQSFIKKYSSFRRKKLKFNGKANEPSGSMQANSDKKFEDVSTKKFQTFEESPRDIIEAMCQCSIM